MNAGLIASFTRRFPHGPEISVPAVQLAPGSGITILFGASGAGKTTILRCLAGLDVPATGHIEMNGVRWFQAAPRHSLPPEHRRVGFVPQDYLLFPHLTVAANVAYGIPATAPGSREQVLSQTLRSLGLADLSHRHPHELSGGQQQRVALARAIARQPRLLLLDEPLAALDAPARLQLRAELRRALIALNLPTLLVTHDRTEALSLGDQLIVLHQGRIVQTGPVRTVFDRPANPAVAALLGHETILTGRVLSHTDGLATVAIGSVQLQALAPELPAPPATVHVCIRAADVVLTRGPAPPSSARNRFPAVVAAVHLETPLVRIDLEGGFPLKALITRQALEELQLRPGDPINAWIKAPHVHLIAT